MPALATLGWDAGWDAAFAPFRAEGLEPGRVSVQHRGEWDVLTADGEVRARAAGRLRHEAGSTAELPVVGDWVAIETRERGKPAIRAVLPGERSSRAAQLMTPESEAAREQAIAANVDVVFVTASLAEDVNARVLERYLTLAWESGARPVILLTKADLEGDPESVAAAGRRSEARCPSTPCPPGPGSASTPFGRSSRRGSREPSWARPAWASPLSSTAPRRGPSGDGDVRDDGSGRHTTTRRELVALPGGGLVVDNPGMRELHLWLADEGLEGAFEDVVELAAQCRFSDCRHEGSPGVRSRPPSRTAASPASAGTATGTCSGSSRSSRRSSSVASAPAPGEGGRAREARSRYETRRSPRPGSSSR